MSDSSNNTLDQYSTQNLITLLSQDDEALQQRAQQALIQRGTHALPALMSALSNRDYWFEAAETLGRIYDSIPLMIEKLSDERIAHAAVHALTISGSHATSAITAALRHPTDDVRSWAALILESIRDPAATDALIAALHDDVTDVRLNAIRALAALGQHSAIAALANDPDAAVRAAVQGAVGRQ